MFLEPWNQSPVLIFSAKETDPRERHAGDEVAFAPLDHIIWLERVNRGIKREVWSLVPGRYMAELMLMGRESSGCVLGRHVEIVRSLGASIAALATLRTCGRREERAKDG